jgi:hypothetical protein
VSRFRPFPVQPGLCGAVHGSRAAGDAQLAVDVLKVLGDGARADVDDAGDGDVGAALGGKPQDLKLAVGQARDMGGRRRLERGTGIAARLRAVHGAVQRPGEHAEDRAVLLGEIPAGPVERDRGEQAVAGRQVKADLVLDPDGAEELGVDAQVVELLLAEHIADLDRLGVAGLVDVVDQRVLGHVCRERFHVGLGQPASRVVGSPYLALRGPEPDLVVDHDVAGDQAGQSRQDHIVGPGRVVDVGQAVDELRRAPQCLQ